MNIFSRSHEIGGVGVAEDEEKAARDLRSLDTHIIVQHEIPQCDRHRLQVTLIEIDEGHSSGRVTTPNVATVPIPAATPSNTARRRVSGCKCGAAGIASRYSVATPTPRSTVAETDRARRRCGTLSAKSRLLPVPAVLLDPFLQVAVRYFTLDIRRLLPSGGVLLRDPGLPRGRRIPCEH
jgi:hypothetical protein